MRVSEIYLSVQGEGPRAGEPTIFLRFGGCNLRCPGWPCDTQHAIDPIYRKEWKSYTPLELARTLVDTEEWDGVRNLCLTGGEPFLQRHTELEAFLSLVETMKKGLMHVECFSNGTILYPDFAIGTVDFILDWKLPGSGEKTLVDKRLRNVEALSRVWTGSAIKFTIKDEADYLLAKDLYSRYLQSTHLPVYYGVVWGALTNEELIGWVLRDKLPWLLNVQVHNYVWDRTRRGI